MSLSPDAVGFNPWLLPQSRPTEVAHWDGRIDEAPRRDGGRADAATDARVVLDLFDRDGIRGLRRLVGDWSLVVRHWTTGTLVLARDFAGVRPFYYRVLPEGVASSASLDALVRRTQATALEERYVAGFLSGQGCPHVTPYREIQVVPPGCALVMTRNGVSRQAFWTEADITPVRYASTPDYDEHLRVLVDQAIASRLAAPGVAIAELSGGLDSSAVVSVAHRLIERRTVAAKQLITVSYLQEDSPDTPYIREVEAACARPTIGLRIDEFPMFSGTFPAGGTPLDDSPLQAAAAGIARNHDASVFLTGQGGDLVFGNMLDDSDQVAATLQRFDLAGSLRQALAWSKVTATPAICVFGRALAMSLPWLSRRASLYVDARHLAGGETSFTAAFADFCQAVQRTSFSSSDWLAAPVERRRHFRELMLARELNTLQPCNALAGTGYTHPLFDRRLVEFLMGIPADVLCGPGQPRRLMRRALSGVLPQRVSARRSKGPFRRAWLESFKPLALEMLSRRTWRVVEHGWIERDSLRSRLEKLLHGVDCNQHQLGQILMFESWLVHMSRA